MFSYQFMLFHLQYDIDGDGMLDLMFVTFSGDIMFYTPNGTALRAYLTQVSGNMWCDEK